MPRPASADVLPGGHSSGAVIDVVVDHEVCFLVAQLVMPRQGCIDLIEGGLGPAGTKLLELAVASRAGELLRIAPTADASAGPGECQVARKGRADASGRTAGRDGGGCSLRSEPVAGPRGGGETEWNRTCFRRARGSRASARASRQGGRPRAET